MSGAQVIGIKTSSRRVSRSFSGEGIVWLCYLTTRLFEVIPDPMILEPLFLEE